MKTISSFARIQTVAIDKKTTTEDAFKLIRKCVCRKIFFPQIWFVFFKAKIIKNNAKESDDVFADFYMDFCHCHKAVGMMNFM